MKNIFLLKLFFLLFIGCANYSNHFENEKFIIEDLNGYKLDSIQEGVVPSKLMEKR